MCGPVIVAWPGDVNGRRFTLMAGVGLDAAANVIHVEPGATVGEVTSYLLRHGRMLECCLEMEDATLGGLAMAQGMTTHSHVCGLLSETVVEYEIVTGAGDVVVATADNAHARLFRALPLSHGSLGLLVSLKLRVVPAKPWVRLSYRRCETRSALVTRYQSVLEAARVQDHGVPFFVESIAFSPEHAVLMEGDLVDAPPPRSSSSSLPTEAVNRIGRWYKPWFFKHVESVLVSGQDRVEYIPIRDYLMRHDRSMCMTMQTIIPYGNQWWFRWALGWLLPPQMSFLKASHTQETREASIRKQCYQDVAFPAERLGEALQLSDELFQIYPLLVYPCMVRTDREDALLRVAPGGTPEASESRRMNLNLGIYGVPRELPGLEARGETFPMVSRVRRLEAWLRRVGGFQHTYCDSFQTEEEFEQMFNHAPLYEDMRREYGAAGVFPRIYQKTRPEMDYWAWLEEEKATAAAVSAAENKTVAK